MNKSVVKVWDVAGSQEGAMVELNHDPLYPVRVHGDVSPSTRPLYFTLLEVPGLIVALESLRVYVEAEESVGHKPKGQDGSEK